jgi:hypothetical protein
MSEPSCATGAAQETNEAPVASFNRNYTVCLIDAVLHDKTWRRNRKERQAEATKQRVDKTQDTFEIPQKSDQLSTETHNICEKPPITEALAGIAPEKCSCCSQERRCTARPAHAAAEPLPPLERSPMLLLLLRQACPLVPPQLRRGMGPISRRS